MTRVEDIVGPDTLPCEERCQVPEGVTMTGVPMPRHAWPDVLICPNGCGRAWLVRETTSPDEGGTDG